MGKRVYAISFENVAVTLVQDLITLLCGANMGCELHGVTLGQKTGTTVQNLVVRVRRLPATVTPGSGGATPTPQKMTNGDAAATATAHTNDTSKSATSGTPAILHEDVFNTVNGYQFFWPPEDRPNAAPGQALVFELLTAPLASMDMSGTLIFAELF